MVRLVLAQLTTPPLPAEIISFPYYFFVRKNSYKLDLEFISILNFIIIIILNPNLKYYNNVVLCMIEHLIINFKC